MGWRIHAPTSAIGAQVHSCAVGGAVSRVENFAVLVGESLPSHALDEGNAEHRGLFLLPFTFGAAPTGRVLSRVRDHPDDLALIGPIPVGDAEPAFRLTGSSRFSQRPAAVGSAARPVSGTKQNASRTTNGSPAFRCLFFPTQPPRLCRFTEGLGWRIRLEWTLVHGYANPLTIRRFVKLAESPKVLKMLPYGRIRATRSRWPTTLGSRVSWHFAAR